MKGAPKRAKKSGQFSGSAGPRLVSMAPINFVDTTDQTGIYWPRKKSEIYDFVIATKLSNKPPPMALRDGDEEFSDTDVYDEELMKVQRFEIYQIS